METKFRFKNFEMEAMLENLKALLPHRDKIGYIAARNARILREALTEYSAVKEKLIKEYGEKQKDNHTVMISPDSENFDIFMKELETVGVIEHEVTVMTMPYEDVIGLLNGEEILSFDWMLTD